MRRSRAPERRHERGAVAVEAALVTPILLLMVFGIIEMALLLRDDVAATSAVRVGARIASASANAGPGDCDVPCSPANAPKFGQLAADAIAKAGSAMPKDSIDEVWVYKANDKGYPGTNGSTAMTCGTDCVRYTWNSGLDQFRYAGGSWPSSSVNACTNSADAVGVYLKVTHGFVTHIFGDGVSLSDHAVMAFEPLETLTCAPGTHQ